MINELLGKIKSVVKKETIPQQPVAEKEVLPDFVEKYVICNPSLYGKTYVYWRTLKEVPVAIRNSDGTQSGFVKCIHFPTPVVINWLDKLANLKKEYIGNEIMHTICKFKISSDKDMYILPDLETMDQVIFNIYPEKPGDLPQCFYMTPEIRKEIAKQLHNYTKGFIELRKSRLR